MAGPEKGQLAAHQVNGQHVFGNQIVLHLGIGVIRRDLRPANHVAVFGVAEQKGRDGLGLGSPGKRPVQFGTAVKRKPAATAEP